MYIQTEIWFVSHVIIIYLYIFQYCQTPAVDLDSVRVD